MNAEMRAFHTGSFSSAPVSTPMRRTRSPCCPRAANGHGAAAPPSAAMKSRRPRQILICPSRARELYGGENSTAKPVGAARQAAALRHLSRLAARFMAEMGDQLKCSRLSIIRLLFSKKADAGAEVPVLPTRCQQPTSTAMQQKQQVTRSLRRRHEDRPSTGFFRATVAASPAITATRQKML